MRTKNNHGTSPEPDEPCPCGSGEIYHLCCEGQKISWSKGEDGTWRKSVPLSREVLKIIRAQEREFIELFGRKLVGDEFIFFDVDALYSDELLNDEWSEALETAGIPPEIAYASKKTGLIVTAHNKSLLTGRDLREWNEAIDEYHRNTKSRRTTAEDKWHEQLAKLITSEFDRCMVVMGLVLRRGGPLRLRPAHELASGHMLLCLTKALKSMQAVRLLTDKYLGEDSLVIVRSIFEAYLHCAYLLVHPEKAADLVVAKLGLVIGTHEYRVTSNGRKDYSRIVEKTTGQVFEGRISFKTMAAQSAISEDGNIYEVLYEFLSEFSHPGYARVPTYVSSSKEGMPTFDHTGRSMFREARALGFIVGSMLLHVLFESNYFSGQMTQDLQFYLCRTRKKLLVLLKAKFPTALVVPLRARIMRLPTK